MNEKGLKMSLHKACCTSWIQIEMISGEPFPLQVHQIEDDESIPLSYKEKLDLDIVQSKLVDFWIWMCKISIVQRHNHHKANQFTKSQSLFGKAVFHNR